MGIVRDMMKPQPKERAFEFQALVYKVLQTYDDDGTPSGDGDATLEAYRDLWRWGKEHPAAYAKFSGFGAFEQGKEISTEICRTLGTLILNGLTCDEKGPQGGT